MGRFIGEIEVKYFGQRSWGLTEPFGYETNDGEIITVPSGFEFDFASVPRLFWIAIHPTGDLARASVIHDYLYVSHQINGREIGRTEANDIFLDAMIDSGVSWWKRNAAYVGVFIGGDHAWRT
jgi:hypothetical protein